MPKRERILFDPVTPVWKIRDIIDQLGGVGGVQDKLMKKGLFPPPIDTIQGWSTRNSVPGAWSPALFGLAQEAHLIKTPFDALVNDFRLGARPSYPPHKFTDANGPGE